MSWIRRLLRASVYAVYLLVVTVALLELIFRFLPVAGVFDLQVINQTNPIIRFEQNASIENSIGWNFYQTSVKSTNNYGYVSSIDYEINGKPDIAVIGDSFVSAVQVDNDEMISERLMALDNELNVYAIGIQGVPLSQYIKFAEHVEEKYSPSEYLIVVVGNDFDESICDLRPKQGTYCFDKDWNLKLIDFPGYSFLRTTARSSALMRYTVFNLGIDWRQVLVGLGFQAPGTAADEIEFAGNTDRTKPVDVVNDSYKVIDEFISRIKTVTNNKKTTILVDADRTDIYRGEVTQSYFRDMRNYLISEAKTSGINVIDMEPVFTQHYQEHNLKFEFPTNAHWNELGHDLAARAYFGQ